MTEMRVMTVDSAPLFGSMDVDAFEAFLEPRPHNEDWDLIDGVAIKKAPATYAHRRITGRSNHPAWLHHLT